MEQNMTSIQDIHPDGVAGKNEEKWFCKPWVIVTAILCFGPFGLFPLWLCPRTKLSLKILISSVVMILTVWMTWGMIKAVDSIISYYSMLLELSQ